MGRLSEAFNNCPRRNLDQGIGRAPKHNQIILGNNNLYHGEFFHGGERSENHSVSDA